MIDLNFWLSVRTILGIVLIVGGISSLYKSLVKKDSLLLFVGILSMLLGLMQLFR